METIKTPQTTFGEAEKERTDILSYLFHNASLELLRTFKKMATPVKKQETQNA